MKWRLLEASEESEGILGTEDGCEALKDKLTIIQRLHENMLKRIDGNYRVTYQFCLKKGNHLRGKV